MNRFKDAKLTPKDREGMVRRLDNMPAAAVAAGFSARLRTAQRWKSRYRQGSDKALWTKINTP